MSHKNILHDHSHECGDLKVELIEHFPYAVFSVSFSLIGAALLGYFSFGASEQVVREGSHVLFHAFHFMHIVFAATGAMLSYFRFSKNIVRGIVVAALSTMVFCILSDILLPYAAGILLGVDMHLHICFVSEIHKVLPFLLIGLLNGWVLSLHKKNMQSYYSIWSHFTHIFVSAVSSLLYMISHGFSEWESHMGVIFIVLILAVVIPCTMSDVVVPLFFAEKE